MKVYGYKLLTSILNYANITTHFTLMRDNMKRFLTVTEHTMTDQKYNDLVRDGFEPTEFITSITADHARDRGLETKVRCIEIEYNILDDVCRAVDNIATDKAFDELEEAMLKANMCPSGNCEA